MHYFEVAVAGVNYHGVEALTYSFEHPLLVGAVVSVPMRTKLALGIVLAEVPKPSFAAKPIAQVYDFPPIPENSLRLMEWLRRYYPSTYGVITQLFLPSKLPKRTSSLEVKPRNIKPIGSSKLPPLTAEQVAALDMIPRESSCILHGDTGTGKTRVYIQLALEALERGKSSIVLTPEIGLTSQLKQNFEAVFGKRVIVIHSQLTEAARRKLWLQALTAEEPLIVLGPRSALFAPLKNIGLIVVDEAHETAYKQDQSPYYHANKVASALASFHGASLVLGSATPLVGDYFLAEQKNRPIVRMTQTAVASDAKRDIKIIDLRDRSQFSRSSFLSTAMLRAIDDRLEKGEQSLIFLNRRGTARVVFCEECGWQANCLHCDTPLVYHGDTHKMRCHSCSYTSNAPVSCPECSKASIVFRSIGTKAIVDEIQRLFPDARIRRFDTDNAKDERIEQNFDDILDGKVDIIIGTQTLAKGLDLPKLSLVGVVLADASLVFPDFSASERTYQLLSQVVGRVGRGHRDGQVILQTYNPDSALLKSVIGKDWQTFYKSELTERQSFNFPPFCFLLKLSCRRARQGNVERSGHDVANELRKSGLRIIVEGPTPAFHEKIGGKYEWQIIVKAKDRSQLLEVIDRLPNGWTYNIDPLNLL